MGVYRDCQSFFKVTPIISGIGKATNFKLSSNFVRTYINKIDRNKSSLKLSGKVAVGQLRDSQKLSGHAYRVHRAVIFAVAQLSCY